MAYSDRSYSHSFASGGGRFAYVLTPWVKRLLIANFAIWLLMVLGLFPYGWTVNAFGFSPATFLRRPWSPLTYMFIHGGFWHVFFNMVAVFFFGPPLERTWGGREFVKFYLVCGLGAAFTSFLLIGIIGSPLVIGASGAVFGLLLAFAMKWPNAPLYIWGLLPIKAKYFVGILGVVSFYATFTAGRMGGGGVAHWTHLGGFVSAWIYLKYGDRIETRLRRVRVRTRRLRVHRPGQAGGSGGQSGEPRRAGGRHRRVDPDTLDEVDRILDKIREQGIDALSTEEREYLDEMSRRYRGSS
jgi:membrane associated rhomboid family serine protease